MGAIALMDKTHGRQCRVAVDYLRPAAHHGSWGNVVRRGFNNFLIKNYQRSLIRYLEGSEMGYEVAQSNAAYILDRLYVDENSIAGRIRTWIRVSLQTMISEEKFTAVGSIFLPKS